MDYTNEELKLMNDLKTAWKAAEDAGVVGGEYYDLTDLEHTPEAKTLTKEQRKDALRLYNGYEVQCYDTLIDALGEVE